MLTVGLPRGLLYHRYGTFWERWLQELGFAVRVSAPTTKETLELGLNKVSSEVCLPVKIIAGHVEQLKNTVDYLFLPRLVWMRDRLYACPKMIGIVDLARLTVPRSCRLVAPTIKGDFALAHLRAGLELTRNPVCAARAYCRAAEKREAPRPQVTVPDSFERAGLRIALLSHFYNLNDEYIARSITEAFVLSGVRTLTKEDVPPAVLMADDGMAGAIRWVYERELYNAFRYYLGCWARGRASAQLRKKNAAWLDEPLVDGVCAVISFGCGPDSLVVELMQLEARKLGMPFMQLVIDEHTGKAGIVTRIEAFIDTVSRQHRHRREYGSTIE